MCVRAGVNVGRNIIHGSDGPASAAKEIAFWFKPEEVVTHVRRSAFALTS
jgi:nucleoside-diphosphate kinase